MVGIHNGHRITPSMMVGEIELLVGSVLHDVLEHWNSTLEEIGRISFLTVISDEVASNQGQIFRGNIFEQLASCGITTEPKSNEISASLITLEDSDMLLDLSFMT